MPQRKIDSLSSNGAQLVASLLARIDGLMAQIAARDERIDELLAQVKALNARIAEFEAKRGGPPKTPDNSSLPPSRGQKANAEPPAVKRPARRRAQAGRESRRDATLLR
jgi:transposase